jgi:hypothetical protein
MTTNDNHTILKPFDAKLVLIVAIFLPGMGQVINNAPKRGFFMACFMVILGLITFNLAQPHISMIGKLSGGIFIYAISVLDAYYWAKYRIEIFTKNN